MKRKLFSPDHVFEIDENAGKLTILLSVFTYSAFFKNQIAFMSQKRKKSLKHYYCSCKIS